MLVAAHSRTSVYDYGSGSAMRQTKEKVVDHRKRITSPLVLSTVPSHYHGVS